MSKSDSLFAKSNRPFLKMWFGQAVSLIGTGMTRFALMIFVWQQTQQATAITLVGIIGILPSILIGAFAGTYTDRWNRKLILIASDSASGIVSIGIFLLALTGMLQLWHIYLAMFVIGIAESFQYPAFNASITLMVPKSLFSRTSGLLALSRYFAGVASPILAGIVLAVSDLAGVLFLDLITFAFAISTIIFIAIPQPDKLDESEDEQSVWQDTIAGFRYIVSHSSFIALTIAGVVWNVAESFGYPLITPFILARTGGNEATLATVMAMMGLGGVAGGVLASVWSGPKRKIHSFLIGALLTGLLGDVLLGAGDNLQVWLIGGFGIEFFIPIAMSAHFAIWQIKIPASMQGRIFAVRGVLGNISELGMIVAIGPLADFVFEPAMMSDGQFADALSGIITPGAGAGMGLMLVIGGLMLAILAVAGYLFRPLRDIETLIPDAID